MKACFYLPIRWTCYDINILQWIIFHSTSAFKAIISLLQRNISPNESIARSTEEIQEYSACPCRLQLCMLWMRSDLWSKGILNSIPNSICFSIISQMISAIISASMEENYNSNWPLNGIKWVEINDNLSLAEQKDEIIVDCSGQSVVSGQKGKVWTFGARRQGVETKDVFTSGGSIGISLFHAFSVQRIWVKFW